jgi:hypothetical protein
MSFEALQGTDDIATSLEGRQCLDVPTMRSDNHRNTRRGQSRTRVLGKVDEEAMLALALAFRAMISDRDKQFIKTEGQTWSLYKSN